MEGIKRAAACLLAFLCFCAVFPAIVYGQNAAEEPQGTPAAEGPAVYAENFSANHRLKGGQVQATEYFHTGDWDITGAVLRVVYAASPLLLAEACTVRVELNGQEVYLAPLPETGSKQVLEVPLPPGLITTSAANRLDIFAVLRKTENAPCGEIKSDAFWFNLYAQSAVEIAYIPRISSTTIGEFHSRFTDLHSLFNRQCAVATPAKPTDMELTMASLAMLGASSAVPLYSERIGLANTAGGLAAFRYVILLAEYENIPADILAYLDEEEKISAQQEGLIALLQTETTHILLVTAQDEGLMQKAGSILCNPAFMRQQQVASLPVAPVRNHRTFAKYTSRYAGLVQQEVLLTGYNRQEASFSFSLPVDQIVRSSSELKLDFSYSEEMDFSRSLVTVYINDIPVGSKKLEKEQAQGDTLILAFPDELDIIGMFSVTVVFDFVPLDDPCLAAEENPPWGRIHTGSMLSIQVSDDTQFRFEYFPTPFFHLGRLDNVVVTLPQTPGQADYETLRLTMLALGQGLEDNTGSLQVMRGRVWGDLSEANIIAIGRAARNAMLMENLEAMSLVFGSDAQKVLSNEKILIDPRYSAAAGVCQMVESPYSPWVRCLMVISGVTDEAMLLAANHLETRQSRAELYGNIYITGKNGLQCFEFLDQYGAEPPATWAERVSPPATATIYVAVATLLLCLLAAILHIRKYRRKA